MADGGRVLNRETREDEKDSIAGIEWKGTRARRSGNKAMELNGQHQ
jgi:hypothetical protein